ncbi:recombinase family protein [Comamonas testosteroni]|uniref:recombinase family protein n=1 Tax=Comamonas testosteroni TaxID=285 RepID=UPI0009BF82A7|nr:recombinase family protein [Comamonas testosteroni]
MIDAYSYIRFSSHAQTIGDSLRRQMQAATAYAHQHGLHLREDLTFRDLGVSAYDSSNLEKGALSLFLQAVKSGQVKRGSVLLVENLDRLTRASTYRAVALLAELIEAGIKVVTLSDGMEYTEKSLQDDKDLFYSVMLFARGHDESKRKSELISKVYEGKRRRNSKIICSVAPGWLDKDKDNECWVLNKEKSESVVKVFNQYLSGLSAHKICQNANEENWPLPSMRKDKNTGWHVSLVRRILKNPAVIGNYIERNKTEHKEFFPRVISDEDFAQAQLASDKRRSFPKRRDQEKYNIFQGIIFCGYCSAVMGYRNHGAKNESHKCEHRRYFCSNHVRGFTDTCKGRPGAKETQSVLIQEIFSRISIRISSDEKIAELQLNMEAAQDLREELKKRENNILDMIEFSPDAREQLAKRLSSIKYDIGEAEKKFLTAQADLIEAKDGGDELLNVYDSVSEALLAFEAGPEEREKLRLKMTRYVKKVYLYFKEGLAYVYFSDSKNPMLLMASNDANIIRFNDNGDPYPYKPPLPKIA